jgi:hypothetical protein
MSAITQISIEEPCSQNWQQMAPITNGRFCTSCSKAVTDMTAMTNQQIIDYLAAGSNICGRIRQEQLLAVNSQLQASAPAASLFWKRWTWAAAMLLAAFKPAKAQQNTAKPATQQAWASITMGLVAAPGAELKASLITIQGQVVDDDNREPLIGATITAGNYHTLTDAKGKFTLQVPAGTQLIHVQHVGYDTRAIKLKNKKSNRYYIKVKSQVIILGGLGAARKPQSQLKTAYQTYVLNSSLGRWMGWTARV